MANDTRVMTFKFQYDNALSLKNEIEELKVFINLNSNMIIL